LQIQSVSVAVVVLQSSDSLVSCLFVETQCFDVVFLDFKAACSDVSLCKYFFEFLQQFRSNSFSLMLRRDVYREHMPVCRVSFRVDCSYDEAYDVAFFNGDQAYRVVIHQKVCDLLLAESLFAEAFFLDLVKPIQLSIRSGLYGYGHSTSRLKAKLKDDLAFSVCHNSNVLFELQPSLLFRESSQRICRIDLLF